MHANTVKLEKKRSGTRSLVTPWSSYLSDLLHVADDTGAALGGGEAFVYGGERCIATDHYAAG